MELSGKDRNKNETFVLKEANLHSFLVREEAHVNELIEILRINLEYKHCIPFCFISIYIPKQEHNNGVFSDEKNL